MKEENVDKAILMYCLFLYNDKCVRYKGIISKNPLGTACVSRGFLNNMINNAFHILLVYNNQQ